MKKIIIIPLVIVMFVAILDPLILQACKCVNIGELTRRAIVGSEVIVEVKGDEIVNLDNVTVNHEEKYYETITTYGIRVQDLIFSDDPYFSDTVETRQVNDVVSRDNVCSSACSPHPSEELRITGWLNPQMTHILVLEREANHYIIQQDFAFDTNKLVYGYLLFESGKSYDEIKSEILKIKSEENDSEEPFSLEYLLTGLNIEFVRVFHFLVLEVHKFA